MLIAVCSAVKDVKEEPQEEEVEDEGLAGFLLEQGLGDQVPFHEYASQLAAAMTLEDEDYSPNSSCLLPSDSDYASQLAAAMKMEDDALPVPLGNLPMKEEVEPVAQEVVVDSDQEPEELEHADSLLAHLLMFGLGDLVEQPHSQWLPSLNRQFRKKSLSCHPDHGHDGEEFEMLRAGKEWLAEQLASWASIFDTFGKASCLCSRCLALYQRRERCRHCLGTSRKNPHTCALSKVSSYFARYHKDLLAAFFELIGHGVAEAEAKMVVIGRQRVLEVQEATERSLQLKKRKHEELEAQTKFDQALAKELKSAVHRVTESFKKDNPQVALEGSGVRPVPLDDVQTAGGALGSGALPSLVPAALHTCIVAWCIVLCCRTWPIWSCRNLVRHADQRTLNPNISLGNPA